MLQSFGELLVGLAVLRGGGDERFLQLADLDAGSLRLLQSILIDLLESLKLLLLCMQFFVPLRNSLRHCEVLLICCVMHLDQVVFKLPHFLLELFFNLVLRVLLFFLFFKFCT